MALALKQPRVQQADFESVARQGGNSPDVFGYRSERRSLFRWIDGIHRKPGTPMVVTGPTGSGKTRLARAAAGRAQEQKLVVCLGACEATHGPFSPFVEALREALEQDLPRTVRDHLASCIARRPELAELLGQGRDPTSYLSPDAVGKGSLFQAVAQACLLLSASGPALIVAEDIHLADDLALEFVKYLIVRARVHRLLILITCRTEASGKLPERLQPIVESIHRSHGLARMTLGGLNDSEAEALIRSVYGNNLFSADLKQGLMQATAGNPSAIIEALKLFETQGIIYREGAVWRERRGAAARTDTFELYDSLVDRLQTLSPEIVRLLRLAALSGHSVDPAILEAASGLPRVRFVRSLGVLTRIHGVLSALDQHYEFTSDRIRETVVQRIPKDAARWLHGCLGDALETLCAETRHEIVEPLAEHRLRAGDIERALPCLLEAGDRAARFCSDKEALQFYDKARAALNEPALSGNCNGQLPKVLKRQGETCTRLSRWEDAESCFRSLMGLGSKTGDRLKVAQALRGLGRICAKRKEYDQALEHFQLSLQEFLAADDAYGECEVLTAMGAIYLEQGRWKDLERTYESALKIAREHGCLEKIVAMAQNTAVVYGVRGHRERARRAFQQCLELNRRLGRWDGVVKSLTNLGNCCAHDGDPVSAKHHYLSAIRLARRRYDIDREAVAKANLAEVLLAEGNARLCEKSCEDALRQFVEIDHKVGIAGANRLLGGAAALRGDHYTAFTRLEKSIAIHKDTGHLLGEAESRRDYGRFLMRTERGSATGREQLMRSKSIFLDLGAIQEVASIDEILESEKAREPAA